MLAFRGKVSWRERIWFIDDVWVKLNLTTLSCKAWKKNNNNIKNKVKLKKTIAETKKGQLFKPNLDSVYESHRLTHV